MIEKEFDLDELFTLNYSFDKLKDVLAYLLAQNKQTAGRVRALENQKGSSDSPDLAVSAFLNLIGESARVREKSR